MLRLGTLRARLTLLYLSVILTGFILLLLLAGGQLTSSGQAAFVDNVESNTALIARALSEPLEHYIEGEETASDLAILLTRYEAQAGGLITIIDGQGRTLVGSGGGLSSGDQSLYPEVAAALRGSVASDIRPDEAGVPTVYAAAPIRAEEGAVAVLRLQVPTTESRTEIARRWMVLGAGAGVVALLALGGNFWLASILTRPVTRLRTAALALAGGDLGVRVQTRGQDELAQLGRAFNHMADQLQAMVDEQRAFVANASHELRSPLAAIKVRSEALAGGALDAATRQRYAEEIDSEVVRLSRLVQDLMLLAQVEAGRASQGEENPDLARQLRAIAHDFEPDARERNIRLSFDVPEDLPPVRVNPGHVRAMLSNLLDNALKYTPDGGQVDLRAFVEGTDVVFEVTDNGQGIAPEDIPHVFERFYRADKARTRQIAGSGLGLSIVKTVADFNGCKVELTSKGLGTGTTVRLCLPAVMLGN